ncbi:MAG: RNA polymerase sigma factor [Bryobacteraceae bacterium]
MTEHADRVLVQKSQRGDGAALGELFSRYWRVARAVAFGVTGEFASAEDAAAEAFTEAFAAINSLRNPDRFRSWLRTIAVRKARHGLQSRHAAIDPLAGALSDRNERPDEVLLRLELGALVRRASRELPDPLREAIALVYFEGYEPELAARFLDIPAGTLRRRLHDGRVRLRAAVEKLIKGSGQMNEERARQIQRLKAMIDSGAIYEALRGSLTLRPPASALIGLLLRQQPGKLIRETARRLPLPSDRALDPTQPVGSITAAIRKALPDFQDWQWNATEAAARFVTLTGSHGDRLQGVLPPGFAEGRPGAYLRATRAMVLANGSGGMQSVYEHLRDSPDERVFREAKDGLRLSDVLDLTWMAVGALELRAVQELLERLTSAVLPGTQVRYSAYDEPRYRSALTLQIGSVSARAASGGVLAEWPRRPNGVDAAHVRIFLEPWATLRWGRVVELQPLPEMLRIVRD